MESIPLPSSTPADASLPPLLDQSQTISTSEEAPPPPPAEKKEGMCEEISYDEIYMPGELEGDAGKGKITQQNAESMETQKVIDNGISNAAPLQEDKPAAVHPPAEIVENVMRHVESELSKEKEKEIEKEKDEEKKKDKEKEKEKDKKRKDSSDYERSRKGRSSPKRRRRGRSPTYSDSDSSSSRSRSRSRSPRRSRRKRDRRDRSRKRRSSSSSSRGTYEGFDFFLPEDECPYSCKECRRGFYTIKELAEHEIRAHDMKIPCAHCDKNAISVTKLAAHMLFRHPSLDAICHYCDEKFGGPAEKLEKSTWDDFRSHVYKEVLKKRMYDHSSKSSRSSSDAVALRGVGRCPHGAAVKCKNFPNCPGAKCIYSHGLCRYDLTCNKSTCPFDHTNRPRVCMACVNDMRGERSRRRY